MFFDAVVRQAREAKLDERRSHFTVDGTLIEAWASLKSFRPKGEDRSGDKDQGDPGNRWVDFHGEKRGNETHESKSDPGEFAGPQRVGQRGQAVLRGTCVDGEPKRAFGRSQNQSSHGHGGTGGGRGDDQAPATKRSASQIVGERTRTTDTHGFVNFLRGGKIVPHVAANTGRKGGSAIDRRTTRHQSYSISRRIRKRIEEIFGWAKTVGGFRKTRYRGTERTQMAAWWVGAAYNLVRMAKLTA